MRGLRLGPAAEYRIDRHQRDLGELRRIFRRDGRIARAVEVLRRDLLRLGLNRGTSEYSSATPRVPRRSTILSTTLTGGSARMLRGGRDDVELVGSEFLDGEERLVLPGQQHVADAALDEGDGRAAGAGVEHRHVL